MRKTMVLASGAMALLAAQSGQMMMAAGAGTMLALQAAPALAASCANATVDAAIRQFTGREPFSSECDPGQYADYSADLKKAVGIKLGYLTAEPAKAAAAKTCANAEIERAIKELTGRSSFPNECNPAQYNGGKWANYAELKHLIAVNLGYEAATPPARTATATPPAGFRLSGPNEYSSTATKKPTTTTKQPTPPPAAVALPKSVQDLNREAAKNLQAQLDKAQAQKMAEAAKTKKDFVAANKNQRKGFADPVIKQVERIGGQDYFKVGDKWYLQTAQEFGTRIGIPVPGMVVLDGSKFTQARTQNGKPEVWTGTKWVQLVGNDGASLIGNDSAGMVAAGGLNLVGNDGASLTSKLVGNDGASLISNFSTGFLSNTFMSNSGAGFMSNGSAGFIADNTGKFISTNGATMVAAGGGNMVAAGGGNMVAAGGGNIFATPNGLVAAGGGNVRGATAVPTGAGNFISTNGGTLAGNTGSTLVNGGIANRAISDNGAGIAKGATAVPTGAGNILSNANGAAVARPATVGSYRAYTAAAQPNQAANQVSISPDKAAAWRFDPKTNQQQFQYGGRWYVPSGSGNGLMTGVAAAN